MKVLFRKDKDTENEFQVAQEVLGDDLLEFRSDIPAGEIIVPRYSALPFYRDLEREIEHLGSSMINSYQQHQFVAEMEWYEHLKERTPDTWFEVGYATAPDTEHGWVVKGVTNSRKFKWDTHMFADDRDDLRDVMNRLLDDSLIGDQGLAVREYVPLEKLEDAINGLPVTNEWRCFFLNGKMLAGGFYWSQAEKAEHMGTLPHGAKECAEWGAEQIKDHVPFFVIDVARTRSGQWIIIEVNDGQMSGLSMIDPETFYQNLSERGL